jgi:hypothetical protein
MLMPFIQAFRRKISKAAADKACQAAVIVEALEGRALLSGSGCSMAMNMPVVTSMSSIVPESQVEAASSAPAITSSASTRFPVSIAGTFTVTSSGSPNSVLKEVGALPTGVTFTDNGDGTATLAGTPASGTDGLYTIKIHARNGVLPAAKQTFELTVAQAPTITSANNITFGTGTLDSFKVKTSGFPIARLSESGALPAGVTFVDDGNGKAKLSGTPASGTAGNYTLTIHAKNGTTPNARQTFTLSVTQTGTAPAFTSKETSVDWGPGIDYANGAGFPPVTFTTSGTPTAAITEMSALPGGVHFTDNGNGTATLFGTPSAGSEGTYTLTIAASNGIAPAAQTTFTLTVFNY